MVGGGGRRCSLSAVANLSTDLKIGIDTFPSPDELMICGSQQDGSVHVFLVDPIIRTSAQLRQRHRRRRNFLFFSYNMSSNVLLSFFLDYGPYYMYEIVASRLNLI